MRLSSQVIKYDHTVLYKQLQNMWFGKMSTLCLVYWRHDFWLFEHFFFRQVALMLWLRVTEYIHSSTVLKYNFYLHFIIFIFFYCILRLHYNSEENIGCFFNSIYLKFWMQDFYF